MYMYVYVQSVETIDIWSRNSEISARRDKQLDD